MTKDTNPDEDVLTKRALKIFTALKKARDGKSKLKQPRRKRAAKRRKTVPQ